MDNKLDLTNAIQAGLYELDRRDRDVTSANIEALADFKGILRALLNRQLVIATPDKLLPEGAQLPNKESEGSEGNKGEN